MVLAGRREIFTDAQEVTKKNICEILVDAFSLHNVNAAEIEYLQKYERGIQPILQRKKEIRPEINFKAVENHAAEITAFKVGYDYKLEPRTPITFVAYRAFLPEETTATNFNIVDVGNTAYLFFDTHDIQHHTVEVAPKYCNREIDSISLDNAYFHQDAVGNIITVSGYNSAKPGCAIAKLK